MNHTEHTGHEYFTDQSAIEALAQRLGGKNVVLGAYLTGREHPQHGTRIMAENIDYIAGWLHSGMRLKLDMVILHDGLSEAFQQRCHAAVAVHHSEKKRGTLTFLQVAPGRFTIADERFLAMLALLERVRFRNIFMVDVSDAWFNADPFKLVEKRSLKRFFDSGSFVRTKGIKGFLKAVAGQYRAWRDRKRYTVFIGGESNTIGDNPWMQRHIRKVFGQDMPHLAEKPVYNCGILGGDQRHLVSVLRTVKSEMERCNVTDVLNDMAVFNRVLHDSQYHLAYSNGVLNSPWKAWAKKGKHAIFHK
ncbi:hypothetical protein [Oleidesulfovibrio sp.]|uniref:hypothetical protein n=1 Tax=Oleidesulfovibrio sp. TaxID=2909707 RepID=UPI003A875782